jgi:hypothetical protein
MVACLSSLLLTPVPGSAATYGVPVKGTTGTAATTVVNDFVPANGGIDFYIPLDGTETYGVSGGGLSSDSCWGFGCGGSLSMYLRFSPVTPGPNLLTLRFEDLDLNGVNDPSGFLETLELFSTSLVSIALFDHFMDPYVVGAQTNANGQKLQVPVNVAGGPFLLKLKFKTVFPPGWQSKVTNTPEALVAYLTPVPLPAALWLFAAGLAGLGCLSRRLKPVLSSPN